MMNSFPFRHWLVLLALSLLPVLSAKAAEPFASDWGVTDQGRVRLIAAPDSAMRLGVQFQLRDGWKIYWRSPGDAGLAPEFDWTEHRNAEIGAISWPVPERFSYAGLETFGYEGEILLPIALSRPDAAQPSRLAVTVNFLTCREICVPNEARLSLDLPAGIGGAGPWDLLFDRAAAAIPQTILPSGWSPGAASLAADGKDAVLRLSLSATPPLGQPDLLIEDADNLVFLAPKQGPDGLVSIAPGGAASVAKLIGKPVTATLIDRAATPLRAVTIPITLMAVEAPAPAMLPILALAILGGFILNFMPCVLPVLSIKLLSLISHAGHGRQALRWGFLASAAGILASFLVMAVALILARQAGAAIGWGIQFQEPVFLAGLAALVTLFACNLMGWFEINLPWWLMGWAGNAGGGPSLGGSFAAGAFATLLATPCSAPFLGTAVGFALAGSNLQILAVFLCLGLGLAAPYLLVALVPGVARILPRPGRWMLNLRRVLGLMLAATALWLVVVLVQQAGLVIAAAVGGLALLASLALALQSRRSPAIAALLLLGMLAPPALLNAAPGAAPAVAGWTPYSAQGIQSAVASGRVVLVDVTASWCLTCQVNERLVLGSDALRQRLAAPDIVAMRADWTRPDPAIAAYLKSFGKYGIPFYAVYGPGAPEGLALPEVLTDRTVLDAMERAAKRGA